MATPLLLVVHGRSGGLIPDVYRQLARELEQRRQGPVSLLALAAPSPGLDPVLEGPGLTLVPLLLLPGNHARVDVPALARQLGLTPAVARAGGGVRRLPFLGAWPAWQRGLAAELAVLADQAARGGPPLVQRPLLLHHPLEGGPAPRYLAYLERRLGCRCLAAPYSSQDPEDLPLAIDGPSLPLALAANRLTERLEPRLGSLQAAPLLARPRLRQLLLDQLVALP